MFIYLMLVCIIGFNDIIDEGLYKFCVYGVGVII